MIEFKGEISDRCTKFVLKQETKVGRTICIIVGSLLCVGMVLLAVYISVFFWSMILPLIILSLAGSLPQKNIKDRVPKELKIIDSRIYLKTETFERSRAITDVKRVIDFGDFYNIEFYFQKGIYFVCQKDLITEGTIEEFEKIFEDKIVRKFKSGDNE